MIEARGLLCLCLVWGGLWVAGCDDGGGADVDMTVGAGGGAGGAGGGAGGAGGAGEGGMGGEGGGMASCADDDACPPGSVCRAMACVPACESDDDCGPSAACTDNACQPRTACATSDDCGAGQACACTGYCVDAPGNPCQGALQCTPQEYCDDCTGTCTPRVDVCGRCSGDAACTRRGDICAPMGEAGRTHCLRACPGGQGTCDNLGPGYQCRDVSGTMACVPETNECSSVQPCNTDQQCPQDHFCNESGRCQPGCMANDLACPNGELCQGLRCGPPCANDGDCGDGGECQDDGHCRVPGGCLTSADCTEAETYCDVEQRQCVAGCQVDDDCFDATLECVAGSCRERGCAANYQCAFGEVCDIASAQCVEAEGRHCEEGCDPMDEMSCGDTARCLSLQDEEENPIGDFCFERCLEAPNECPQGYDCIELQDMDGNVQDRLCIRRCDYTYEEE